jgi:hypothetical protein
MRGGVFRDCVTFAQKANSIRIGTESGCACMGDILFENVDVLCAWDGIRIDMGEGALCHDVTFRHSLVETFSPYRDPRDKNHPFAGRSTIPGQHGAPVAISLSVGGAAERESRVTRMLFEDVNWADPPDMGVPLEKATGGPDEAASHIDPLLRMHIVGVGGAYTPQFNATGKTFGFKAPSQWYLAAGDQQLRFSAAGYYFAKELRAQLGDVPVGSLGRLVPAQAPAANAKTIRPTSQFRLA